MKLTIFLLISFISTNLLASDEIFDGGVTVGAVAQNIQNMGIEEDTSWAGVVRADGSVDLIISAAGHILYSQSDSQSFEVGGRANIFFLTIHDINYRLRASDEHFYVMSGLGSEIKILGKLGFSAGLMYMEWDHRMPGYEDLVWGFYLGGSYRYVSDRFHIKGKASIYTSLYDVEFNSETQAVEQDWKNGHVVDVDAFVNVLSTERFIKFGPSVNITSRNVGINPNTEDVNYEIRAIFGVGGRF